MRLLFVCTGNTCRSPMAVALAWAKIRERELPHSVDSAGLYAFAGQPMTHEAVAAVSNLGASVESHEATPITRELIEEADLVLAMMESHLQDLRQRFPDAAKRMFTLGGYALAGETTSADGDIPDPYGGSLADYERCARRIDDLIDRLFARLEQSSHGTDSSGAQE